MCVYITTYYICMHNMCKYNVCILCKYNVGICIYNVLYAYMYVYIINNI